MEMDEIRGIKHFISRRFARIYTDKNSLKKSVLIRVYPWLKPGFQVFLRLDKNNISISLLSPHPELQDVVNAAANTDVKADAFSYTFYHYS
jgi:hypothetical protein